MSLKPEKGFHKQHRGILKAQELNKTTSYRVYFATDAEPIKPNRLLIKLIIQILLFPSTVFMFGDFLIPCLNLLIRGKKSLQYSEYTVAQHKYSYILSILLGFFFFGQKKKHKAVLNFEGEGKNTLHGFQHVSQIKERCAEHLYLLPFTLTALIKIQLP